MNLNDVRAPRAITRRRCMGLIAGVGALGAAWPTGVSAALLQPGGERSLSLHSLHTHERIEVTYYRHGTYDTGALADIDRLLRDWRTGDVEHIDVKLVDLLCALRRRLDSYEPFEVVSGYRSPRTNAQLAQTGKRVAKRSLHMRGKAIDIRLPGTRLRHLHRAALELQAGGVGLYSKSGFIHVDTGRVRRWGA